MVLHLRLTRELGLKLFCVILRNCYWNLILARATSDFLFSPLCAECQVARLGLALAHDLGLKSAILEDDSSVVISLLGGDLNNCPWDVKCFISDCTDLCKSFEQVSGRLSMIRPILWLREDSSPHSHCYGSLLRLFG